MIQSERPSFRIVANTDIAINPREVMVGRGITVKPSSPPGIGAIGIPVVSSAISALISRDKKAWFDLFSERTEFSDDGIPRDLAEWCEEEFFGRWHAHIISIDKVEDGGLTFYARYHSDKWGDFKTFWRFKLADGKIAKFDVGATDY
jgi:hypothetical protein